MGALGGSEINTSHRDSSILFLSEESRAHGNCENASILLNDTQTSTDDNYSFVSAFSFYPPGLTLPLLFPQYFTSPH